MEGVQGAILRVKLRYLDGWTEARRSHCRAYDQALSETGLGIFSEDCEVRHVRHIYPVFSPSRQALMHALAERGIQTGIHYPTPVHLLPAHADLGYHRGDFPVSETLASQEVSLPLFPELTETQIHAVASAICESVAAVTC